MGYNLWIARQIMLKHRGDLSIEKVNEGLSIVVSFPLCKRNQKVEQDNFAAILGPDLFNRVAPLPIPDDDVNQEFIDSQSSGLSENAPIDYRYGTLDVLDRTLRILVVDDSAMVRKMTIKLMNSLGHSCEEADDGDTAVEMVRSRHAFDIILMDNQMPRMTGEDATEVLRRELNFQGIILGVTGNALDDDIQRFITKGVDEVIIKPMTTISFVESADRIMKKRNSSNH